MAALSAARNTVRMGDATLPDLLSLPVAASTTIYKGGLVMLVAGYAKPGGAGATGIGVGRAEETVVNSGSAGDKRVEVRQGVFKWGNSASADAITAASQGEYAYIVDDNTVAKLQNSTQTVKTLTPTAANDTVYNLLFDFNVGGTTESYHFTTTSDSSATATEIADAFRVLFAASAAFTARVVATGTATIILTAQAGSGADFTVRSTGPGVIAIANTTPAVTRARAGRVIRVDSDGVFIQSAIGL